MQITNYSCLAHCVHLITGLPEQSCMDLCKTKLTGTSMRDAYRGLKKLGHKVHMTDVNSKEKWFVPLWKFPTILSVHKGGSHAILIKNGMIYDPSGETYPVEAFEHIYQGGKIEEIIIIEA